MSIKFTEIERVFVSETPDPVTASPFSTILNNGSNLDLASITIDANCDKNGILLFGVVNWSITVTPLIDSVAIAIPAYGQISFDILLNGIVIYRVTQTAAQFGFPITGVFGIPSTTYNIATLLHFDTSALTAFTTSLVNTYTLRASNIILTPPLLSIGGLTAGGITAAAGPVTFLAEKVEAHRQEAAN